jgi:hypothetical protein
MNILSWLPKIEAHATPNGAFLTKPQIKQINDLVIDNMFIAGSDFLFTVLGTHNFATSEKLKPCKVQLSVNIWSWLPKIEAHATLKWSIFDQTPDQTNITNIHRWIRIFVYST